MSAVLIVPGTTKGENAAETSRIGSPVKAVSTVASDYQLRDLALWTKMTSLPQ